jgi:WD40 repeat protein
MSAAAASGWSMRTKVGGAKGGRAARGGGGGAGPEPEPESGSGFAQQVFKAKQAKGGCFSVQYSYDGGLLAAGFNDGNCFCFDTKTGKSKAFGGAYERGRTPVTALRFRPKNFTVRACPSPLRPLFRTGPARLPSYPWPATHSQFSRQGARADRKC